MSARVSVTFAFLLTRERLSSPSFIHSLHPYVDETSQAVEDISNLLEKLNATEQKTKTTISEEMVESLFRRIEQKVGSTKI